MTLVVNKDGSKVSGPSAPVKVDANPVAASTNLDLNPAEGVEERKARLREERSRVSMSVPKMKMQVPEIPGYKLYWFNDDQGRIQQALRSKYQFVEEDEIGLHDFSLAGDSTKSGNQDMGSRVSMVVGTSDGGQPRRAYLMKIAEELWAIDQELQQERNDQISLALKGGRLGAEQVSAQDLRNTYVRTAQVSRSTQASPVAFGQKADI